MSLWKLTTQNKYGNLRSRILYNPTNTSFGINPKGLGPITIAGRFKYEYTHPFLPPTLYTNLKGEKFIVPTYQKVHPKTEFIDIKWIRPKVKKDNGVKSQLKTFKYQSSSSSDIYTVKEYLNADNTISLRCNCAGYWRVKDKNKGCKHIQETRKNNG